MQIASIGGSLKLIRLEGTENHHLQAVDLPCFTGTECSHLLSSLCNCICKTWILLKLIKSENIYFFNQWVLCFAFTECSPFCHALRNPADKIGNFVKVPVLSDGVCFSCFVFLCAGLTDEEVELAIQRSGVTEEPQALAPVPLGPPHLLHPSQLAPVPHSECPSAQLSMHPRHQQPPPSPATPLLFTATMYTQ